MFYAMILLVVLIGVIGMHFLAEKRIRTPYENNRVANTSIRLVYRSYRLFKKRRWQKQTEGVEELESLYQEVFELISVKELKQNEQEAKRLEPHLYQSNKVFYELMSQYVFFRYIKDKKASLGIEKIVINRSIFVLKEFLQQTKNQHTKEEGRVAA